MSTAQANPGDGEAQRVALQPVDGGPDDYGQFANGLPSSPNYFPIAGWLRPAENSTQMAHYRDFGMNTFDGVECPECAVESTIRDAGLRTIIQSDERSRFDDIRSENAGWFLADEEDMCCGPPGYLGGDGYQHLADANSGLPDEGKVRIANFGKGVLWWETDADAERFVNLPFIDIVSADAYWFTDPLEIDDTAPAAIRYGRASSYGWNVERLQLDAMDGKRKPVWMLVELGWPFTDSADLGGRRILPAEARAAVWHSIIAGARGTRGRRSARA